MKKLILKYSKHFHNNHRLKPMKNDGDLSTLQWVFRVHARRMEYV